MSADKDEKIIQCEACNASCFTHNQKEPDMNGQDELKALRSEIDAIDTALWPLLEKRMQVVCDVADVKRQNNLPVLDAAREDIILERVSSAIDKKWRGEISLMVRTMLALSKSRQRFELFGGEASLLPPAQNENKQQLTCAHQGIAGAWSEQALKKVYPQANVVSVETFEDIFKAVASGEVDYGFAPIENSQTGAIGETYSLLRKYGCYIAGRTELDIRQCLLAKNGTTLKDIRRVYSHPEALSQCRKFLQVHNFEEIPKCNTAVAAQLVAEEQDDKTAAIASLHAAASYGLQVLQEDIMDTKENRTSFIILSKAPQYDKNSTHVSITFSTAHRSGALCEALLPFMSFNINLARIESRPDNDGRYRFFADLEGNILDENMTQALRQVMAASSYFEVLGCYSLF